MKENEDIFGHLKKRKIETPSKDYFDALTASIIEQESNETKVIPIGRKIFYWSTAAAAILVVGFFLFNIPQQTETNILAQLDDVTTEELIAYVDENIDDFDADQLGETLSDEEIEKLDEELSPEMSDISYVESSESISFDDIDEQEILDYLELEDIDLDELENDFI
ncbi:MAG: hypothetical protein ACO2Z9_05055 [Crocinitomicaceae bacterium]